MFSTNTLYTGLLDNFHEYDIIDADMDLNGAGVTLQLETPFNVFGVDYGEVTVNILLMLTYAFVTTDYRIYCHFLCWLKHAYC